MTRTLKDLEYFIQKLRDIGFKKTISFDDLRFYIAKEFGFSDYHYKNTYNALIRFGFIKEIYTGVYEFVEKKPIETIEFEAKKEAEKCIEEIKNAKPDKS